MDRRMIGDILTQYARMGNSTKRLFRQQRVTRRRQQFGFGPIGGVYDPPKRTTLGAKTLDCHMFILAPSAHFLPILSVYQTIEIPAQRGLSHAADLSEKWRLETSKRQDEHFSLYRDQDETQDRSENS